MSIQYRMNQEKAEGRDARHFARILKEGAFLVKLWSAYKNKECKEETPDVPKPIFDYLSANGVPNSIFLPHKQQPVFEQPPISYPTPPAAKPTSGSSGGPNWGNVFLWVGLGTLIVMCAFDPEPISKGVLGGILVVIIIDQSSSSASAGSYRPPQGSSYSDY
jgi:hypothetical protein